MTTIITDGRTLACDTQVQCGNRIDQWSAEKTVITDERVYALAGECALMTPLIKWHEAGANPRSLPVVTPPYKPEAIFWVFEGGLLYEYGMEVPYKLPIGVPNAIGTGSRWAIGALMAGASPEQAVRIAMKCDVNSGGEVRVIELPPHLQVISAARAAKIRGGKRRAERLSPERRSEIAQEAANQRWSKESADH